YSGIFPDDLPTGLPPQQPHDHKIELEPGAHPTVQRQFRLTQPGLDELRKQLDYLLEKEFIRPSSSPFAAPILFTPKKDGGFRLCIDYRALNRATIKSRYPIPRVDELIDQLRTARVFLKIDLRGGYHQIRVNPPYCPKTTFRTRYGSFEYNVMPFGLTNTLATFQMTMSEAFRPLFDKCVIVYLDDILIYSPDRAQHLQDIEVVLKILSENRLLTKASMREFLLVRLEFLGHIISAEGDTVNARYSSAATAALGRLLLPYLFPELSAFATVEDLVSHLRASDARYRAAAHAEFLDRNQPPMFITLYFIVTRLPDSLRSVKDRFLSLDPTVLTVDLLEQHLLAAETSVVAVGAARGTPRTPFFEGCSPSPLAPSYASAAAVDILGAEDVGAASASAKCRSSKGKGGRGGGGGSGSGGGGSSGDSGGSGCGGSGGSGGGRTRAQR
ncbi:unnamed protein product, partial [Closterium sp. NIES-53]